MAIVDWWAVFSERLGLERIAKPATLATLTVGAALIYGPRPTVQVLVVLGLAFGLLGDILLLGPKEKFLQGLASFLVGHLAYVVAFVLMGARGGPLIVGLTATVIGLASIGTKVARSVKANHKNLFIPVVVYELVIAIMVIRAIGTTNPFAISGSLLFALSDGILAYNKFVAPLPRARLIVIVSYHLGQAGIALSLVR